MTIKTSSPKHEKTVPVNARLLALRVIDSVFSNGAYSNIALNKAFSANKISDLDRRFVTELVYGCIKAKGTLDWILEQNVSRSLNKISPVILNILRLGVFQIYFLERIPASAACNEAVNLAKKFGHIGTVKFVNAVLRNCVRNKEKMVYPSLEENKILHLALKLQHPEWLVRRWISDYGLEETEKLCGFNNQAPPLTLRVNTLVITRDELLKKLAEDDFTVRPSEWSKDGIVCDKLPSLELLFKKYNKCFYVQDESSMLVAGILEPKPGQRVIDVCSAPGGKTTHLAQLMENKGEIIATDIHPHKIGLIKENAERLGIEIIKTEIKDASDNEEAWNESADCVLVDAPCSGLGVLRRRAEARWTKTEIGLKEFPKLQLAILNNAARYLKQGGRLVYSTCTLESAENFGVVQAFLELNKQYELAGFAHPKTGEIIKDLQVLPQNDGMDGFYICALKRKA